jgi:hypothetical protein
MLLDVVKTRRRQQFVHGSGLVVAVFQPEPAAGPEVPRRPRDDLPDCVQPVRTAGQRRFRFVAQIAASSSSRSPSMIASILYSVRLMRWSVTRPCGKL